MAFIGTLREVVERNDSRLGRSFDLFVQGLIVISLISFSIETLPDLPSRMYEWLTAIEMITIGLFTAEYLLRIFVAERRRSYLFSFFGIVDLLAILPFYVASGIDLRAIRALRLLRLIRVFKLARYSAAVQRFHRAFLIAREELFLFLFVAAILLYLAGVGIFYFENAAQPESFRSVFPSLWWAIATLTTVGYGDIYPITAGGRAFTFFVLVIGLGIVSVPAGLVASALSKAREMEDRHSSDE